MPTWKKVIVSGSTANLAALQVDNLTSGQVVIGGGASNLSTTAINGTGAIVATTGASGLSHSGSFSGSFQGTTNLPDLTQGTGITAFTYDGSTTATVSLKNAGSLSSNVLTKWDVTNGQLINASLTDNGTTITGTTSLQLTGASSNLSGSFSGSFQGSLTGTSSYATQALSSSFAQTASFAVSASFAPSTPSFPFTGSAQITGSLGVTGSFNQASASAATGLFAHAQGIDVYALGEYSHAEGNNTSAIGNYSHAEGWFSNAGGTGSHAEGGSTANGDYSHAEGWNALSSGSYSHAEGYGTTAIGPGSHAEGDQTTANGVSSHAEGFNTVASGDYQHVQGQYNLSSSAQSAFIVGNGTGTGALRSNLIFASGSKVQVTGSVIATTGFTGSLLGNATTVTVGLSSSAAAVDATGLSKFFPLFGSVKNSGGPVEAYYVNSGSFQYIMGTNTLTVTSSYANQALSASYASSVNSIAGAITGNTDNRVLTATGGGTINGEGNLTFDGSTLTVTGNEIITGNLTVQGTASFQNTTNLEVADRFVLFASGSNTTGDGGIVVQQGTQNVGELYGYDSGTTRWAFTSSFSANQTSFTPAAFITTTEVSTAVPSAAPLYGGASNGFGNIHVKTDTGDIYIYA